MLILVKYEINYYKINDYKKNSFKYQDFNKLLNSNLRFMLQLEKNANITEPNYYAMVPMHKLTAHKFITEDIKIYADLDNLPGELRTKRFVFELAMLNDNKENVNIVFNAADQLDANLYNYAIKSIKIRFLLLYEASSKDHQKHASKIYIENMNDNLS